MADLQRIIPAVRATARLIPPANIVTNVVRIFPDQMRATARQVAPNSVRPNTSYYRVDFENETPGNLLMPNLPQGLRAEWGNSQYTGTSSPQSGSEYTVVADATATGGRYLRRQEANQATRAIAMSQVLGFGSDADAKDVEVLVKLRRPVSNYSDLVQSNRVMVVLRGGGEQDSGSDRRGYAVRQDRTTFQLVRFDSDQQGGSDSVYDVPFFYEDGSYVLDQLDSVPTMPDEDVWFWIRFSAVGAALKAKVWQDGVAEPSAWMLEATDTEHRSGWVGVGRSSDLWGDNFPTAALDLDRLEAWVSAPTANYSVSLQAPLATVDSFAFPPLHVSVDDYYSRHRQFDEYPANERPHDFGVRFGGTNSNFRVRADATSSDGYSLETTSSVTGMVACSFDDAPPGNKYDPIDGTTDDIDVVVRFKTTQQDRSMQFWVRGSGAAKSENGYVLWSGGAADLDGSTQSVWGFRWSKWSNGVETMLWQGIYSAGFAYEWYPNTWYWMRIRVEGASVRSAGILNANLRSNPGALVGIDSYGTVRLRARIWEDDEPEPDQWYVDYLDDGRVSQNQGSVTSYTVEATDGTVIGIPGQVPPVTPPHDRGWIGWGTYLPNGRRNIDQLYSRSLPTRVVNTEDIDWTNRLSRAAATFSATSGWTVEGGATLAVSTSAPLEGASSGVLTKTNSVEGLRLRSNEVVPVLQGQTMTAMISADMLTMTVPYPDIEELALLNRALSIGMQWLDGEGTVLSESSAGELDALYVSDRHATRKDLCVTFTPAVGAVSGRMFVDVDTSAYNIQYVDVGGGIGSYQAPVMGTGEAIKFDMAGVFYGLDLYYLQPHWGDWAPPVIDEAHSTVLEMVAPVVRVHHPVPSPVPTATATALVPTAHITRPQHLRPTVVHSAGGWTDKDGGTALLGEVNEAVVSDETYIRSVHEPVADTVVLRLTSAPNPDPEIAEAYVVRYRFRRRGDQAEVLTVSLLQGDTEIASWVENDMSKEYVTAERELTTGQIASITDYTDLRLRLVGDVVS